MERESENQEDRGERESERWRDVERPGPRVNNKETSVPAPGPAKLGGGRRAEEANEDKEKGEGGPRERTLAQEPWPTLIFQKNRLYIDLTWALADIGGAPAPPAPPLPPPSSQIGQGSALNKQLYKSWWSLFSAEGRCVWRWKLTTSQPCGRQKKSSPR